MEKSIELTEDSIVDFLNDLNQKHIADAFNTKTSNEKLRFIEQVKMLQSSYPGGIKEYISRASKLLIDSKNNVNPYMNYKAEVPTGEIMDFTSEEFIKFEDIGIEELSKACFVLLAGGLGERLGYPGIKIGIPVDLFTEQCYFSYYAQYILAYQSRLPNTEIPICIMTSDDTHIGTIQLLENNNYFKLKKEQVTIVKQEKVPALLDNDCHIAMLKDEFLIDTKPHGHGDVHTLLYQYGVLDSWLKKGKEWLIVKIG